ncbi:MAG: hypothetical protein RL722_2591 [Pseudomonadota bacterium]|jgi:uncharacterized protein YecT (DUF1311 family)
MRIFLSFLLAISAVPAIANAGDDTYGCDAPDTSTRFEACLTRRATAEADKRLNATYQLILTQYDKSGEEKSRTALVDAQRAWIRYRDKTCQFENEEYGGAYSISEARCLSRLVNERLEYLSQFVLPNG